MAQAGFHQGEGDTGIHRFTPTKAKPFHQHPRHLGDIGIGIGIGGPPSHHHQQGVAEGWALAFLERTRCPALGRPIEGFTDAGTGRLDHLEIHAELTAVVDLEPGLGGIGVEHRGDVVFGVARGKQHRRHGQHMAHAPAAEGLQAIPQDRFGEFEVAVFHRHLGNQGLQPLRQLGKFANGQAVAAAMAAHQHPQRPMGPLNGQGRWGGRNGGLGR